MGMSDRLGLLYLLQRLRPETALEIGTSEGGSLEVIARHSGLTYSIDINPEVAKALRPHFDNVEFLTGDSAVMIPRALRTIADRGQALQFVLVDGSHTERRAREDIDLVLQYRPTKPMYIVVHDSFNPAVRRGILAARWAANPHVHAVGVDFVMGDAGSSYGSEDESRMWGGLAMAVLMPQPRTGELHFSQDSIEQFEMARKALGE
jgi:cephalosporin hydroxylase